MMDDHAGDAMLRVLIVDDHRDTADSLALLVEMWGFTARVAYDGPAAIEEALAYLPDVIILDLAMPGMTGWAVAERLRGLPGFAETVLVAHSGYGEAKDIARSKETGFDRHVVKPFDLGELDRLLTAKGKELVHVCLLAG